MSEFDGHRIPHECRMGLALEVITRRSFQLGGEVGSQQLERTKPAIPMMVPKLDSKGEPAGVTLRHDHMEVRMALEDSGEGEPTECFTHAHALVVPTDEVQSPVQMRLSRTRGRNTSSAD